MLKFIDRIEMINDRNRTFPVKIQALVLVIYLSSNLCSKHFSIAFVTLYMLFTGKVLLLNLLVYFFCKGIWVDTRHYSYNTDRKFNINTKHIFQIKL